jgi:hypothetical protein
MMWRTKMGSAWCNAALNWAAARLVSMRVMPSENSPIGFSAASIWAISRQAFLERNGAAVAIKRLGWVFADIFSFTCSWVIAFRYPFIKINPAAMSHNEWLFSRQDSNLLPAMQAALG